MSSHNHPLIGVTPRLVRDIDRAAAPRLAREGNAALAIQCDAFSGGIPRRVTRARRQSERMFTTSRTRRGARSAVLVAVLVAVFAAACAIAPVRAMHNGNYPTTGVNTQPTTSNTASTCSGTTFGPDYGCTGSQSTCTPTSCGYYTWQYENTYYFVDDNVPTLPKPFTGLPRVNPQNQEEYMGQMVLDEDYGLSLASQAMPGLVIAVLLLVSMILVAGFYLLSSVCKCCGMCQCCFRPTPYTRKQMHMAKGIQFAFVLMAAAGCLMIYIRSPDLTDGILDIADGLVNSTTVLVDDVTDISDAISGLITKDISVESGITDLKSAADTVKTQIVKTKDLLEKYVDQIKLGADIMAGVILGVAFITMALSILNFWRLLTLFAVITSLILILSWIVVGVLAAVGVFLADFCYTGDQYLINPKLVDLSKDIPCPDAQEVVEFGNEFRQMIVNIVTTVNTAVDNWNSAGSGTTNSVKKDYICLPYQMQNIVDLCGSTTATTAGSFLTPYWSDDYSNYVCEAYANGELSGITNVYPPWDTLNCANGSSGSGYTNYTANYYSTGGIKHKYLISEDLSTAYSGMGVTATDLTDLAALNAVFPKFEGILKCQFIADMFASMSSGCHGTADAIADMWKGFVVISVAYLCLWIAMLVTLGRMSNADLMIDGGRFNAKKAGLI